MRVSMSEAEIIFKLSNNNHDAMELADAIFNAGFTDAVIGTGLPGTLGVKICVRNEDEAQCAAHRMLRALPHGSQIETIGC